MSTYEERLKRVAVLIPSLDPDEKMVQYVNGLKNMGFRTIIVVDDGSHENTQCHFESVRKLDGVVILRHAVNQGKGRALKTGFHYFLNTYQAADMAGIVTADADGQHSVEDTVKVALRLNDSDGLILGIRNFKEENVPFKSKNGNQITTAVFAALYGKKINDTQTGLRGIPYSFVSECLKLEGERFDYEIVMLIQAVREKMEIVEERIETIYIDSNRATHFRAVVDSARIYKVIFRMFFQFALSGLLSFLIDIGLFAFFTKVLFWPLDVSMATFVGTVLARICSSLFNYTVNKHAVFRSEGNACGTLFRYYVLCAVQLLCSWLLVVAVYEHIQWDTTFIKICVDILLFFISFQIQRLWVYKEA